MTTTLQTTRDMTQEEFLQFLDDSPSIKPKGLVISDLKWKYLVRSVLRGKNIYVTGPAGSGKTLAAKAVAEALGRPMFIFNMGSTQDPRAALIGNVGFDKEKGTYFSESEFVRAIQTKDAVIIMDEMTRAHPEAGNILMTVFDENQRYLRLDEADDQKVIRVAEGVSFIAPANVGAEYTGTKVMDAALRDRFTELEMDVLNEKEEFELLTYMFPEVKPQYLRFIAKVADHTRVEFYNPTATLYGETMISTRTSVEMASLFFDGFNAEEVATSQIYPLYEDDGTGDSLREYVRKMVQGYAVFTDDEDSDDVVTPGDLFGQEEINDIGT